MDEQKPRRRRRTSIAIDIDNKDTVDILPEISEKGVDIFSQDSLECEKEVLDIITNKNTKKNNTSPYIGVVIGIVLIVVSGLLVTDHLFQYYFSQIGHYIEKYNEVLKASDEYGIGYLSGGYSQLTLFWQDMLSDAIKYVSIRCVCSLASLVSGIIFLKKGVSQLNNKK